jgi:hypothetical protein
MYDDSEEQFDQSMSRKIIELALKALAKIAKPVSVGFRKSKK